MDDWKPLNIESEEAAPQQGPTASLDGLQADASTLQAHFEASTDHLEDVSMRHSEVLVCGGMLPE